MINNSNILSYGVILINMSKLMNLSRQSLNQLKINGKLFTTLSKFLPNMCDTFMIL